MSATKDYGTDGIAVRRHPDCQTEVKSRWAQAIVQECIDEGRPGTIYDEWSESFGSSIWGIFQTMLVPMQVPALYTLHYHVHRLTVNTG